MKIKVNNNGTIIEFDTQEEHDLWVSTHSPTPDLTNLIKNFEHESLGKKVISDLYVALKGQNLTQAQEADILNRVAIVFVALGFGFIRGSRDIANGLSVGGNLTLARKNFILSEIDDAITKL